MNLLKSRKKLVWGELDVPVYGIVSDWYGQALAPAFGYSLVLDDDSLWFIAIRDGLSFCMPDSKQCFWVEGLWNYDVAELFLHNPDSGKYLEFNLAANGAWWAAMFDSPRVRSLEQPNFLGAIQSYYDDSDLTHWCSGLQISRRFLDSYFTWSVEITANVTAILNSPKQTFHSAVRLPGVAPDFHQPESFKRLSSVEL